MFMENLHVESKGLLRMNEFLTYDDSSKTKDNKINQTALEITSPTSCIVLILKMSISILDLFLTFF